MSTQIYHGDILYSQSKDQLISYENSYLVVTDGLVAGIYPQIPEPYSAYPVVDHGRGVIIPAFSDLHVHAPQYVQRGLGMDQLLSDWLNNYTFPQESRFSDLAYAKRYYDAFDAYYRDNDPTPMIALIAEYVEARLDEYLKLLET